MLEIISILVINKIRDYQERRALVVKCFPRIHRKVTGSNHSGLAIHEFSFGLLVPGDPSECIFIASIYVFSVASTGSLVLKCQ